MTLADEDTNSILTDNANRAIQGNVAMQVTQSGGQLWKKWKWRRLVDNFAISRTIQGNVVMQVTKSGDQV